MYCPFCGQNFGGSGIGALLSLLFTLLLIAGVVLLIVWLVRQGSARPGGTGGGTGPGSETGRALALLDERYARGEIDTAEYEERRKALTGSQ